MPTLTGILFNNPIVKPLSSNGTFMSGCTAEFYLTGTTTPAAIYRDGALTTPFLNPVPADFTGTFPAIYLDPAVIYRVVISTLLGVLVSDTDPYVPASLAGVTAGVVGQALYPRSAAEVTANVMPVAFQYAVMDPRRYGAVGDGATDDSAAMSSWSLVVNATTNPTAVFPTGLTFLTAPIAAITAANFTLKANGCTILAKPGSWPLTGDGSDQLKLTAAGACISDLTIDGNQANWTINTWQGRLIEWVNDSRFVNCAFKNSPCNGSRTGGTRCQFTNCHFDNNALLAMEMDAGSYQDFTDCTFNQNGYGLHGTFNIAGPVGASFGVALRFRSHHLTFKGCKFNQNGRDGIETGQGTYAVKYIACTAWQNNDGGFTMSNDVTAGGTVPGDGEGPFDVEYVDCEAYDNFGSGIACYCAGNNVTVLGGRYYNNNRAAGILNDGSGNAPASTVNGVYFSGGSQGIRVDTKAYDDRQLTGVSSTATGTNPAVMSVISWNVGSMAEYPKVVFFDSNMVFKGYATLVAESSGSVSVIPTTVNGVVLANIISGWVISQRVQHNGVFFDNDVQATVAVDGFGNLPGSQPYFGYKSISGYNVGGQNVTLPQAPLDYTELLQNPSWDSGTGSGTSWTYTLTGGGAANSFTTAGSPDLRSAASLQLVGGSSDARGDSVLISGALSYAQNCYVEATCWVLQPAVGAASIALLWTPAGAPNPLATTVTHGGGGWRRLRIGAFIPAGSTGLELRVTSSAGHTTFFDNASLRVKCDDFDNRDFSYPIRVPPVV
jgi:hypothetical protein